MEKEIKEQRENKATEPNIGTADKKQPSLKTIIWICAVVVVVLAAVFAVIRFSGKADGGKDGKPEKEIESVTGSGADRETFEIPFAGLTLKYPKEWQDRVTVAEQEDGSLAFTADGTPLFTLYADGTHSVLGTVIGEKNTVISVEFAEIDPNDTAKSAMQEDVNVIILHLTRDYNFEVGSAVEPEDDSTFPIETSVTTLYYPAKWKDQVTVNATDEKVSFSAGDTPLFDLVFTQCDGYLLGTYGTTPVYIVEYPVTEQEHAAMQMGVNVILAHLQEDDQFVVNG